MVETIIDSSELSLDSELLNLVIPSAKVVIDDKEEEFNLEFEGINTTIPLLIANKKIQNNSIVSYPKKFKFIVNNNIEEVEKLTIKLVDNLFYDKNKNLVDCSLTKQGIVILTEELLHPNKEVPKEITDYLSINIGEINTVNIVFFHELGHIIQRQVILDNNYCHFENGKDSLGDFINPIIDNIDFTYDGKSKSIEYESRDVLRVVRNTIHEGFSDLYSCFCIREAYGEEQAKKMIDFLIRAREKTENIDNYYTIRSMKNLLSDINDNKLDIKNFNDMTTYIYETIKNNVFKEIETKFNDKSESQNKHNSFFLGFVMGSLIERSENALSDYKTNNTLINFYNSFQKDTDKQKIVNMICLKYNLPQIKINKEDFDNGMLFVSKYSEEFKNGKELFKFKKNINENIQSPEEYKSKLCILNNIAKVRSANQQNLSNSKKLGL